MKEFKYIKNIENREATIRIYDQIGDTYDKSGNVTKYGVSGSIFAMEMEYLQDKCDTINVRINSEGGSVMDGFSIISSLINSKIPVVTYNDGIAASTAGWCFLSGNKRKMMDWALLMVHGASDSSGNSTNDVINLVNSSIATILCNNSGKDKEYYMNLLKSKKDTYISASEDKNFILENRLADEIINTGKSFKVDKTRNASELRGIYNKLIINKPKMKDVNNKLKLADDASESSAVSAIEAIQNKAASLEVENSALKAKVEAYETEKATAVEAAKVALKNKAEALANKLEADKKITKEEKENVLANASRDEASFEFVKNTYDKVSTTKVAAVIFDPKNVVTSTGVEDRTNWIYNDWEKKDPQGLKELFVNNKEAYNELFKTYKK